MSLFKNDDAPCPICGKPTARILPMKVEGQPICKDCKAAISMEASVRSGLTIATLKQHIQYREENQNKIKSFNKSQTYTLGCGTLDKKLYIDGGTREWYIDIGSNPPVFTFDEFVGFEINENSKKVESGDRNGWKSVESDVAAELGTLTQRLAMAATDEERNNIDAPVNTVAMIFLLKNPYWKRYEVSFSTPTLNRSNPTEYIEDYIKMRRSLDEAAANLMERCLGVKAALQPYAPAVGYNSPVSAFSACAQNTGSIGSVADELKKYKELLDSGAITVAEYNTLKDKLLNS